MISPRFSRRPWFLATLGAFALVASTGSIVAAQDILYRETFGRPDPATGNISSTLFDWQRFNLAGTVASASGISADGTGKPVDLAQTMSAGPVQDGTFNAYAEGWHFLDGTQGLTMTTEYSFDPASNGPVTFRWWQGANTAAGGGLNDGRVVVRMGSVWYASAAIFTNPSVSAGGNFGSTDPATQGAVELSMPFNPAPANWLTLNFDGNYDPTTDTATASTLGAIAVGAAPTSALSGTITGFGFFRAVTGQNFRVDSITIEGKGVNPGDVDADGDVDLIDFNAIRDNFQKSVATRALGDLNNDGKVEWQDYRLWKDNHPFTPPPIAGSGAAVPEPGSLAMLVLAATALAARRRRV